MRRLFLLTVAAAALLSADVTIAHAGNPMASEPGTIVSAPSDASATTDDSSSAITTLPAPMTPPSHPVISATKRERKHEVEEQQENEQGGLDDLSAMPSETLTAPAHESKAAAASSELQLPGSFPLTQTATADFKPGSSFLSLCYHNVEDDSPDQTYVGVTTSKLISQFGWFQENGYHPVSVDDIIAAHEGRRPLPDKAVLLTFDDGYESFYTRVYPILKAFKYPAVLAVVDSWLKGGRAQDMVEYGDHKMQRSAFLTWDQIREMSRSGLVEVASHTDAMHHGVLSNPQGSSEPAVITRLYNAKTGAYESDMAYKNRINADAAAAANTIQKEIGKRPRVAVWPYGEYNQMAASIYGAHGMPITLTLDDGFATTKNLTAVPRFLMNADPDMTGFSVEIRSLYQHQPMRAVQIDLDYVYDADPAREAKNLDALISRIYRMKISTVFLQAFADPKGTGVVSEVYFPNRHLRVRQDLFNRVAWQLATRANVKVYAWMPVLAFDFDGKATQVLAWNPETNKAEVDPNAYRRLSPFDPTARSMIKDVYEDLARAAPFDGLLFHDDATLSDYEDASAPAMAAYAKAGLPKSISAIRENPAAMRKWTVLKTDALINFTKELAATVRKFRTPLATVRNLYAPVILNPESTAWFAQDYDRFLKAYDYTAVLAMPYLENISDSDTENWLRFLVGSVAQRPEGLKHTFFELQAYDWRTDTDDEDRPISTEQIGDEMRLLARLGALSFGYYPDDFVKNQPDEEELHQDFSLQTYPYRQ